MSKDQHFEQLFKIYFNPENKFLMLSKNHILKNIREMCQFVEIGCDEKELEKEERTYPGFKDIVNIYHYLILQATGKGQILIQHPQR